jgi:hypothetical protein
MKFYTVDVKNISSNVPAANFANDDLNSLADNIIASGGLIKPLILKMTGLEVYTVVEGHFEYYAAVRAREKNPRKCEMVNAFVIAAEQEDSVFKQVAAFKESSSLILTETTYRKEVNSLESEFYNEEFTHLKKQINDLILQQTQERQEIYNLNEVIKLLENQIPKQVTPLEAFNKLNLLELTFRLKTAGFTEKKAIQIVESIDKERRKNKFDSLKDVVERVTIANGKKRVKGISGDKMVDIVDTWSRLLFT